MRGIVVVIVDGGSSACRWSCLCVSVPKVEHCRLAGLPDLNQSNPWVAQQLTQWISGIVSKYSLDGIRIDTIPEVCIPCCAGAACLGHDWDPLLRHCFAFVLQVEPEFWAQFQSAAQVYAVGEVDNGNPAYVGPYQAVVDGTLSYPMFFVRGHHHICGALWIM